MREHAVHSIVEALEEKDVDVSTLEVGDSIVCVNGIRLENPFATLDRLRASEGRVELDVIPAARVDKAEVWRAELAHRAVFADLATAPGGCFPIADTARRAITLVQLARIAEHVGRRLGYRYVEPDKRGTTVTALGRWERSPDAAGERWFGGRDKDVPITSVEEVTLYDCNTYVILPATAEKECSMVELMASEEQPPHYFVSHWWGEPIVDFLRCLRRHAEARRLEYKGGLPRRGVL